MNEIYSPMEFSEEDIFAKTTVNVWMNFWIEVFTFDPTSKNDIMRALND